MCRSCHAKGDIADWLVNVGKIGDVVIESGEHAVNYLTARYGPPPQEWQEPLPFGERYGPDFHVDTLPPDIRGYVEAVAEAYQTPLDFPANCALGVGAAVCAGRISVSQSPDWREQVNEYLCIIKDSGERGSPVFREVTAPLSTFSATTWKAPSLKSRRHRLSAI